MLVLTKQGEVKNIYDVYYVPNLKYSLLSKGQLMVHGYDVNFHNTYCKIFDPNKKFVAKLYDKEQIVSIRNAKWKDVCM